MVLLILIVFYLFFGNSFSTKNSVLEGLVFVIFSILIGSLVLFSLALFEMPVEWLYYIAFSVAAPTSLFVAKFICKSDKNDTDEEMSEEEALEEVLAKIRALQMSSMEENLVEDELPAHFQPYSDPQIFGVRL